MRNTKEYCIDSGTAIAAPNLLKPLSLAVICLVAILVVVAYPRKKEAL